MTDGRPAPAPAPAPVPAEKPVPRRVQRMMDLEKLLSPEVGFERVDTYAKWIFGGTAAVAALSALYTKQIVGDLNLWGRMAAALGLVLLALAMGAAARALAPVMVRYTPGSIDSMERALDAQFTARRPWLQAAGVLLAAALAAYGFAPLVGAATGALAPRQSGLRPVNQAAFSYAVTRKPHVEAKLEVAGAAPFSAAAVTLDRHDSTTVRLVAQAAAITDSAGRATMQIRADSLQAGRYVLHARYTPARPAAGATDSAPVRADTVERREIVIPAAPANPPVTRTNTPARPRQG